MWKCNIVWASWQHPKGGPKEARTFATLRWCYKRFVHRSGPQLIHVERAFRNG